MLKLTLEGVNQVRTQDRALRSNVRENPEGHTMAILSFGDIAERRLDELAAEEDRSVTNRPKSWGRQRRRDEIFAQDRPAILKA
jgi:transcription elongation GreA/GreB family factor